MIIFLIFYTVNVKIELQKKKELPEDELRIFFNKAQQTANGGFLSNVIIHLNSYTQNSKFPFQIILLEERQLKNKMKHILII